MMSAGSITIFTSLSYASISLTSGIYRDRNSIKDRAWPEHTLGIL